RRRARRRSWAWCGRRRPRPARPLRTPPAPAPPSGIPGVAGPPAPTPSPARKGSSRGLPDQEQPGSVRLAGADAAGDQIGQCVRVGDDTVTDPAVQFVDHSLPGPVAGAPSEGVATHVADGEGACKLAA